MSRKFPDVIGVLYESGLSTKFKWEIPNFLSLSFTGLNDCYVSDVFSFENTDYRLCIYGAYLRLHCYSVYLKNESCISNYVTCSLSLLKTDGACFRTETASLTSNHWFKNFINMSFLRQNESDLVTAGTLTIVCVLERGLRVNRRGKEIPINKRQAVEDWMHNNLAGSTSSDAMPATKKVRRTSTINLSTDDAIDFHGADSQSTSYSEFGGPSSSLSGAAATTTNTDKTCMPEFPKILEDLKELFLKEKLYDVVISVQGQKIRAHKAILTARSSVFESTFRNNMKEKRTGIVDIKDCDPASFSKFLHFLYCADSKIISQENVFNLFVTADKYDVRDLKTKCTDFIKTNLSVDIFCDTMILALKYSETELIEIAKVFFVNNLQKIILTAKWKAFLAENPEQSNELLIKALIKNPDI